MEGPGGRRQPWARRGAAGQGDPLFFPRLTWKQKMRLQWIKFRNHRPDKEIHDKVKRLTESQAFNLSIIFVILLNSAVIAVETDPEIEVIFALLWHHYSKARIM